MTYLCGMEVTDWCGVALMLLLWHDTEGPATEGVPSLLRVVWTVA